MLGTGKFWLVLFLTPMFALIPDFLLITAQSVFRPNPDDEIIRKLQENRDKESVKNKKPNRAQVMNDKHDLNEAREGTIVNEERFIKF